MTTIRRKLRASFGREGQEGTSLAEMMVVIVILAIVLAIVQGTVIAAQKTTNANVGRIDSAGQAKVAVDTVSRNLRTAVLPALLSDGSCTSCAAIAFVQATPTSVQFYANNNSDPLRLGPTKVTFSLSTTGATAGQLTETIQKPDAHAATVYNYTYCTPSATCTVSTRIIARGVNTSQIFTYYDKTGSTLSGSSLSTNQLGAVDSIDVVIPVKTGGQTTSLTQRVTLPNADSLAIVTATATA